MQIIWPTPGISQSASNRLEPLAILTLSAIRQNILQNSVTLEFFALLHDIECVDLARFISPIVSTHTDAS